MRKAKIALVNTVFALIAGLGSSLMLANDSGHGKFEPNQPTTEWGPGDRQMTLTKKFAYTDAAGTIWRVPDGTVVDGASIPQAFWSVIGGPLEGPYRRASIVHDYFCVDRSEPWQQVHRMFYEAMLAAGTPKVKAKVMYYAVLVGGPRWEKVIYKNHPPRAFPRPGDTDEPKIEPWTISYDEQLAKVHREKIEATDPSLDEIERLASLAFEGKAPPEEVRTDQRGK